MPRYIDADAMKKDLEENYVFVGFADLLNDIIEVIDAQPTADVVEVIRCKECEYWKQEQRGKPWKCNRYYCTRSVNIKTEESDFCSFAKRRDNGETGL